MKTKAEIEAALLPNGLPPENSPTWPRERAGQLNAYVCNTCRGVLVVVLLDWGTTPFSLSCEHYGRHVVLPPGRRRVAPCPGMLSSSFYRVSPLFSAHLSHGFYRPAEAKWGRSILATGQDIVSRPSALRSRRLSRRVSARVLCRLRDGGARPARCDVFAGCRRELLQRRASTSARPRNARSFQSEARTRLLDHQAEGLNR